MWSSPHLAFMCVSSVCHWWHIQRDLSCHFFPVFLHNLWGILDLWNISPGLVCGLISFMWTLPSQIHKLCLRCSCQVCDLFISIPLSAVWSLKSGLHLWVFCSSRPVCLWDKTGATGGGLHSPVMSREGRKHFQSLIFWQREPHLLQCHQRAWPSLPSGAGLLVTPAVLFPG